MKDGATKSFEQAYNAQAAVDEEAQVIVDPAYLGLFLGKQGANVSSASKLTGVAIKIIPSAVSDERKKRDLLAITGV